MKNEIDDTEEISTDPFPRPERSLLTLAEIANRLAISEKHLRNMIESGRFPCNILRFGRSVRVLTREFALWVACSCPEREIFEAIKACSECRTAFELCKK